jgi:hypothetical protein
MGGQTTRSVASMLVKPVAFRESQLWANFVCTTHEDVRLLDKSFTVEEHSTANRIAPRGKIITSAYDSSSVTHNFLPTICTDTISQKDNAATTPRGSRFIASGIRKLEDWRAFFCLLSSAPISTKPKLLTYSGHDNVSILLPDIPLGRAVFASTARATIKRITGAPCLGRHRLSSSTRCPQCGITTRTGDPPKRHSLRCPNGEMRHLMHARLVGVLSSIHRDVGVSNMAVVTKARGLTR